MPSSSVMLKGSPSVRSFQVSIVSAQPVSRGQHGSLMTVQGPPWPSMYTPLNEIPASLLTSLYTFFAPSSSQSRL